ncbi:MAG: hypothetical protein LBT38_07370 [Deltaproteobacteria bacterium]|nr:hypothetical protein [Deltaproteobacteria bacterium]
MDLRDLESYAQSFLLWANKRLSLYPDPKAVAASLEDINVYPNINSLAPPQTVEILDESSNLIRLRHMGQDAVLLGQIIWEHAAAGEGTRLGLGPKFMIKPTDLDPAWPGSNLNLGLRRLSQLFFEIYKLAQVKGLDPLSVLSRQRLLVISGEEIIDQVAAQILNSFSQIVPPDNWLFMAQAAFYGLKRDPSSGQWVFDYSSPRRLYNHGAMVSQKVMDGQIFSQKFSDSRKMYLSHAEFFRLLAQASDLVSLNIEDLDYLTQALDFETLGLAVDLGLKGYGMVMEITGNNPNNPIKGGMCAYDQVLGRDVVIESFRLKGLEPKDITHLNKNFNHYPQPSMVFGLLREKGLFLPAVIHDEWLYFQPVQGDLNFLAPTAYFSRRNLKPINSLKSLADIPAALTAFAKQDLEPGYGEFLKSLDLA